MDIEEIDAMLAALEHGIETAPSGALFMKSGAISLDFLMEFGEVGSDLYNPESLLIQAEETARFERIVESFITSITQ